MFQFVMPYSIGRNSAVWMLFDPFPLPLISENGERQLSVSIFVLLFPHRAILFRICTRAVGKKDTFSSFKASQLRFFII
jgi:hypothetical protein